MRIFTLLAVGLFPATGFAQQPAGPSATPDPVRREIMAVEERIGQPVALRRAELELALRLSDYLDEPPAASGE